MPLFSCLLRKAGSSELIEGCEKLQECSTYTKMKSAVVSTVNARFMELLNSLSSLEGGGLPVLSDACRATCEQLEADQACVCLLGADNSATIVACAGLDGELALGRRMVHGSLEAGFQSNTVVGAALHMYETSPTMPILYKEAGSSDCSIPSGWTARSGASGPSSPVSGALPVEWQRMAAEHKLTQFAAAVMVAAGSPIGVLTLAARGSCRPCSWTPEVVQTVAVLLAGHIRLQGQRLADALSLLHTASTMSEVVEAVGEAAVEVTAAVAHVRGQARVAFMQPDGSSAAIFQQQATSQHSGDVAGPGNGLPSPLVTRSRRTSCEYVMRPSQVTGRKGTVRGSIEVTGPHPGSGRTHGGGPPAAPSVSSRADSLTDMSAMRRGKARMSFTMPAPGGSGPSCKGHTLPLSGTLLAEALSKEAAGLCVSDCASYVQDNKAFPRDTVLSRDGVMPLSLALATASHDGRPLLAIYLAYSSALPQPLLQAVVAELQQLVQAILPIIKAKLSGELKGEWVYLKAQLEEAVRRKGYGDAFVHGSTAPGSEPCSGGEADASVSAVVPAVDAAAAAGGVVRPPLTAMGDVSFSFHETAAARNQSEASGTSPSTTGGAAAAVQRRLSLLGPTRSEGPAAARPNSGLRKLLGMLPSEMSATDAGGGGGPSGVAANVSLPASGEGCHVAGDPDSLGDPDRSTTLSRTAPNRRLMAAIHGVSFKLEAAKSPRGASRLAPIITIMHERLKAAQAAQMTGSRSEARKADLSSVKLIQEIGKGGYGTVYRGTYHGSEVAVKVIQEKELAALQTVNDVHAHAHGGGHHSSSVLLHKQNIHDAIELVASVSVSHPNIVQVLTFFTDCKLQLPESNMMFDSMDVDPAAGGPAGGGPARLVHSPSLLESPAPGQDVGGGISVALVMEYMDAGCLSDAIQNRVFFERLDPPPNGMGRPGKGLLAVSMRSVYATLLEVALALRHMHSLHLVHCDLKPQNVLLKTAPRDPRGFTAKLSDFGLAKTMAHDENGQLVIDEAVGSGTITHIAPEVFMGKKSLGAAVDIYAFGIIMFQVLCGMRLYEGMTAQDIANAVAHRMMRPALPNWVPTNYRALAERCWHQVPSVRPTADELVRQLERLSDFKRRGQARPQSGQHQ